MPPVFGIIAIGLAFASALTMAIPILRPKPILISSKPIADFTEEFKRSIITEVPIFLGLQALERAISKFNTDLWTAFLEQRKYMIAGLVLLASSVAFQITELVL